MSNLDFNTQNSSTGLADIATNGKNTNTTLSLIATILQTLLPRVTGTFTLSAAATTTVVQNEVTANSVISTPTPTNAAAATLMGSAKSLYISAKTPGASFTVATANGVAAAGTETFQYQLWNPV